MMAFDTTSMKIAGINLFQFFSTIGVVFSTSLFILLLLKYNFSIKIYTKIFLLSGIGMFAGSKMFGFLTSLYRALGNGDVITWNTFVKTGIVFYGGLIGFLISFILICLIWNKYIEMRVVDLAIVCIPLFHFWGRLGCFFGGCCFGRESESFLSILYTNRVMGEIITVSRIPIQLVEAVFNLMIFSVLMILLFMNKFTNHLMIVYLVMYAPLRFFIELFRGDEARGVWFGVSFSQVISILLLLFCWRYMIKYKRSEGINGIF